MAHELTITNGAAEMAYIGEKPWHGLGQELAQGASLDQWRVAAGMNWKVDSHPVTYMHGDVIKTHPTQRVLLRSDNGNALGVVSNKYKEVQPEQIMEFFRDLTEQQGYTMETAGTMFGGSKFWALASIGQTEAVGTGDDIGGYILLSTACDGTMATQARFTTVRVVCNNTLSMALNAHSQRSAFIRHSSHFDAKTVKTNLGIANDEFHRFMEAATALTRVEMSIEDGMTFAEKLLRDTKIVTHEDITKAPAFSNIIQLFSGDGRGSKLASSEGTAWGMVNAVTEYVDHFQKASSNSLRMQSAWFGRGDKLKTAAFQQALALAA